jgi:hypothetical protein
MQRIDLMTKSSSSKPIRIITVQIQMTIPDECISQQDIVDYLNGKLLEDPEFFGGFLAENVIAVDRV